MIISIQLKNFYSIRDKIAIDFTADVRSRKLQNYLPENLIDVGEDKFVNIIGLFGSNAAGKSNVIKAIDFCRNLVLNSHLLNEGVTFDFESFKFEPGKPSEFIINFITNGNEYEYSFEILDNKVLSESLYHFPNKRKARVFVREKTFSYTHGKGVMSRPSDIEANTGPKNLFLSRASALNRPIAKEVYRFFLNEMKFEAVDFSIDNISRKEFEDHKKILLHALEVSDSDIIDIDLYEASPGNLRLRTYHKENPSIPFDFEKEESEGTKRLLMMLLYILRSALSGAALFLDEFDLKMHLHLAEFVLDAIRATGKCQFLFTSHTSPLIDISKLRREQIIFVNKQTDGNTQLIPLYDYQGIRDNANIQKAYLMGRFDAIPYIGNIYSDLKELLSENEKS
ncbi:MAG: ATP-binding protein [Muribaculaceae bacterium]|nr:ATP-binding protein [Muribaculaceae bacterium]